MSVKNCECGPLGLAATGHHVMLLIATTNSIHRITVHAQTKNFLLRVSTDLLGLSIVQYSLELFRTLQP